MVVENEERDLERDGEEHQAQGFAGNVFGHVVSAPFSAMRLPLLLSLCCAPPPFVVPDDDPTPRHTALIRSPMSALRPVLTAARRPRQW